jgi:hypothetical protein
MRKFKVLSLKFYQIDSFAQNLEKMMFTAGLSWFETSLMLEVPGS